MVRFVAWSIGFCMRGMGPWGVVEGWGVDGEVVCVEGKGVRVFKGWV